MENGYNEAVIYYITTKTSMAQANKDRSDFIKGQNEIFIGSYGYGGGVKLNGLIQVYYEVIAKRLTVGYEKFVDKGEEFPTGRECEILDSGIDTYMLHEDARNDIRAKAAKIDAATAKEKTNKDKMLAAMRNNMK